MEVHWEVLVLYSTRGAVIFDKWRHRVAKTGSWTKGAARQTQSDIHNAVITTLSLFSILRLQQDKIIL